MGKRKSRLLRAALSALHYTGADGLLAPFTSGDGVIFMLHHVKPGEATGFDPNGILKVTPEFLETVLEQVKSAGFDCIGLDDVPERLKSHNRPPFAVFTLDDGYKDNLAYAYPIFKKHGVPFTIYIPSSFADGTGKLWWLELEAVLTAAPSITLEMKGKAQTFVLTSDAERQYAFDAIYWWLRAMPEAAARAVTSGLLREAGVDASRLCRDLVMSWDEIRMIASDPLVTIGAHTTNHYALAQLPEESARAEMAESLDRIARETGRPCRHFSYPYGCALSAGDREFAIARSLGVATAVTTRKGLLRSGEGIDLAALPRLSLNGDYQDVRYVKVLLSGAPFAFWNAAGRWVRRLRRPASAWAHQASPST